ncbi:MAG: hypothetical protein QS98_C0008G0014 [archaeon GW2011_AR3]|nr:MAG: hypothetical protein QS98_C0008G0014 [archaeon GW2011_AR3]
MSRNNPSRDRKFMLAMIVIFVALVSVSLASAALSDVLTGITSGIQDSAAKYKFSAINGFIIAALAFVAFSFFAKKIEDDKMRLVVQVILLVFALALAFTNATLKANYIWSQQWAQNLMHLKVIVNLAVITVFIYLVIPLIPKLKEMLQGEKEKFALLVIAFLFASSIALGPFQGGKAYDPNTYKYVWEEQNIVEARLYLLGDGDCYTKATDGQATEAQADQTIVAGLLDKMESNRYCYTDETVIAISEGRPYSYSGPVDSEADNFGGYGILRGKQLFLLIGLGLIFYWFFKTWKIGPEMPFLTGLVAYLLASSMAHNGIGIGSAIAIGEILFASVIYKGMKDVGTFQKTWINGLLSIWLTLWLGTLMFGDMAYAGPLEGLKDIAGAGLSGIFGIVPMALIALGGYQATKKFAKTGLQKGLGNGGTAAIALLAGYLYYFQGGTGALAGLFPGWLKTILVIIILIVFFALAIGMAAGKEPSHSKEAKESAKAVLWAKEYIGWKLAKLFNGIPVVKRLVEFFKLNRIKSWQGTVPLEFREHRHLFQILMNYMLRLEVFKNKANTVKKGQLQLADWYGPGESAKADPNTKLGGLGIETSMRRFRRQLNIFKNGRRTMIKDMKDDELENPGDTNYTVENYAWTYIDENSGFIRVTDYDNPYQNAGMLSGHRLIFELMKFIPTTFGDSIGSYEGDKAPFESLLGSQLQIVRKIIETCQNKYETAWMKHATMRIIQARKIWLLNQYLMNGEYDHTYRFATFDADVYYQIYDVSQEPPKSGNWKVNLKFNADGTPKSAFGPVPMKYAHRNAPNLDQEIPFDDENGMTNVEVAFDGTYMDDMNDLRIGLKSGYWKVFPETSEDQANITAKQQIQYVRVVWPPKYGENIVYHHKMNKAVLYNLKEWEGWVTDLLAGEYKPMSRTRKDYYNSFKKYDLLYKKVQRERASEEERIAHVAADSGHGAADIHAGEHEHNPIHDFTEVGEQRAAFDEEALKDPGAVNYWARKRWNTEDNPEIRKQPYNPYPGISVMGLSQYILFYISKRMEYDEEVIKNLDIYVWWSGHDTHPFAKVREAKSGESDERH